MKIYVVKTEQGLIPATEYDFEYAKTMKNGEVYGVDIKVSRNPRFHRKYMALMRTAWEYLRENQQEFFHKDFDNFRKTIEIAAGWCETVYSIGERRWIEVPKSVSFDAIEEHQFRELYERVKDVLFETALKGISEEEFMKNLIDF